VSVAPAVGSGPPASAAQSEVVLYERRAHAVWLTINRAARRNAINAEVMRGIIDGIDRAEADTEVRLIILTGAGDKAFCAGGDLAPAANGAPFSVDPSRPQNPVVDAFKRIEQCNLPILARVNGHALAGGFGLVCACDLAVAVEGALFGTPESKIGLFPMMIMPYMLRVLPARKFMELCMTGEPIDAQEALRIGVLNEVVSSTDLDRRIEAWSELLASRSPTAIRLGKQGFHAMRDMGLQQALEFAQLMLPMMAATEDAREGMSSYQEKRVPQWTGR
jgi:enoyl-CoA hydratase/carnithine racemase